MTELSASSPLAQDVDSRPRIREHLAHREHFDDAATRIMDVFVDERIGRQPADLPGEEDEAVAFDLLGIGGGGADEVLIGITYSEIPGSEEHISVPANWLDEEVSREEMAAHFNRLNINSKYW